MNTGPVNFQLWLMKTVPGPGISIATSACNSPVVIPPWAIAPDPSKLLETGAAGERQVEVQRVVVPRYLGISLYHLLCYSEFPVGLLSDYDIHGVT